MTRPWRWYASALAVTAAALACIVAARLARPREQRPSASEALAALRDAGLRVQPERPAEETGGNPQAWWATSAERDWRELDGLSKAQMRGPQWSGVAWLREGPIDEILEFLRLPCCDECWLDYRTFYVCGNPELLRRVRRVLATRGWEPTNEVRGRG
jgi:hypothetical protein